jgi:hypothetical protein
MLADGLSKMAPKSARLDLFCGKKHRIQHTKSQMGVAHGSNVFPQCFRQIILQKFGNVAPKSVCLDIFCGKNQNFPANFLKNSKKSSKIRVPVWMEGSPFLERLKSFSFSDRTPVFGGCLSRGLSPRDRNWRLDRAQTPVYFPPSQRKQRSFTT